jgi:hypothetical protein
MPKTPMDSDQWLARCAARLHQRWPHVPDDQLREVAADIQRNAWRQIKEPEHAAVEWLRQGIPDAHGGDART